MQAIEFIMMLFGLCNAPSMFQCLMACVLQGLTWQIALAYLEDVLVYSPTFEEHLKHLPLVFDQFREAGLKLKPNKSHFGQSRANCLGHVITPDGLPQAMDQGNNPGHASPNQASTISPAQSVDSARLRRSTRTLLQAPEVQVTDDNSTKELQGTGSPDTEQSAEDVYQVEKILKQCPLNGKHQFLIKWLGFPHCQNTWEPASNIIVKRSIAQFYKQHPRQNVSMKILIVNHSWLLSRRLIFNRLTKLSLRRHTKSIVVTPMVFVELRATDVCHLESHRLFV